MKKFLIASLFIALTVSSCAQFPGYVSVSSPNAEYNFKGALSATKGIITGVYANLSAANASHIKDYDGAIIKVGNSLYYRHLATSSWVEITTSGGSTPGIDDVLTVSGALHHNQSITGNDYNFSITTDVLDFEAQTDFTLYGNNVNVWGNEVLNLKTDYLHIEATLDNQGFNFDGGTTQVNFNRNNDINFTATSYDFFSPGSDPIYFTLNAPNSYIGFNSSGSTGYGIRDNAGVMQFKNDGGTWFDIPTGVTPGLNEASSPTWTGLHTFNRSVTASSALARGTYVTHTLTAAANNDVLVGLDVAPTFSLGSFTGVSKLAARFAGDLWVSPYGGSSTWKIAEGQINYDWGSTVYLANATSSVGLKAGAGINGTNHIIVNADGSTWNLGTLTVGGNTNVSSAVLNVESTTKGFLPPRMTKTQRTSISSPTSGLGVYDTDLNSDFVYNGSAWVMKPNEGSSPTWTGSHTFKQSSTGWNIRDYLTNIPALYVSSNTTSGSAKFVLAASSSATYINSNGSGGLYLGYDGSSYAQFSSSGFNLGANTLVSSSYGNSFTSTSTCQFEVQSTTKGVLIPRMTKAQRNAISSPADGLMVMVTGESGGTYFSVYNLNQTRWEKMTTTAD